MSQSAQGPTAGPEGLAPLGGPAEAETPRHTTDPDAAGGAGNAAGDGAADAPLEDSPAYELAVEDGAPLPPPADDDPGTGPLAPDFREADAP